ncbi:MAG: hypothetical protein P4L76_07785 [Beijerinckiaceae bacterium]|nr:hypothetical protein [Beijerinckiaceae bacterium]
MKTIFHARVVFRAGRPALVAACLLALAAPIQAADDDCKAAMAERIKLCAEDCRTRALAATKLEDPDNNILFLCIKRCARDMAMHGQMCR